MAQQRENRSPQQRRVPSWTEWGCYFESRGDYGSAAKAYGRAYAEQPNPVLAYEAGVDSERVGDIAQALEHYANVLSTPSEALPQSPQLLKGPEL